MIVLRAYKTELDLNHGQRTALARHAGAARYAYNWGLARKIEAHEAGQRLPSAIDLHRALNELKKGELGWMYEVSKCAPQEALRDLDKAFDNFFRRLKNGEIEPHKRRKDGQMEGYPHFKSRKRGLGSFRLTGAIHIFEDAVQLPRLGRLRLHEKGYLPTLGVKILSATVSEHAGRWFVSVQVEQELPDPGGSEVSLPSQAEVVGVDLGVKAMATCSDGREFENPQVLRKVQRKLKRHQRELARRKAGSQNREKTRRKIARLHYRIGNIRKDALHKATSAIVKAKPKPKVVVLEDLNVNGMLQNHTLALAIADVGLYEFRRQIIYKAAWNGVQVLIAPRFFPSSKLCSVCGCIKDDLTLAEREWQCECGVRHQRDLNAAVNLRGLATPLGMSTVGRISSGATGSSPGSNACGEERLQASLGPVLLVEAGTKQQSTLCRFV
ncbi:MAG: transposase [Thermoflexales bacterium]|nr:transposase [Thermoflexales bacterium]